MSSKPLLICVVGPTAIGKTGKAIEIASALSTEILSADSRQFYREMKIGTAVPSQEELDAVPHHFIQFRSIFDEYSVGDFERDALVFLEEKFRTNPVMVMVGGSGLYVDAVVKGLDNFPDMDPDIRKKLNRELEEKGIEHLQRELQKSDPDYFSIVDKQNPHRLIRALEVYRGSGKTYSSFLNQPVQERNFNTIYIGLTADRQVIYDRINLRVDLMIKEGLIEEAENLYRHKDENALQTVGYRELFDFFDGKLTKEEAIQEIKKNTRRFAKRQLTWYRKNPDIQWFDYLEDVEEILKYIHKKMPSQK